MLWTMWICGELRDGSTARVRTSSARRLADLSDRLTELGRVPPSGQLGRHDDADELAAIDHRQAAYLTLGHQLLGLVVVRIRRDRRRIRGHHLADLRRARILSSGYRTDHDVSVRDDADELAVCHDG